MVGEKLGLVLEGGAMRGMFTAGVIDVMMEQGILPDGVAGVSAGAVFGCNIKSNQPGRVIRYNTDYCRDPRYCSIRSLLLTGDLYGADFCYRVLPEQLDPFDYRAYEASPMAFYAVATDVHTGGARYHRCDAADERTFAWLRASASMPLASRIVQVDGFHLLDGGIADSIPLRFLEGEGYRRNIVVLTQPEGFVKQPNALLPLLRVALRAYPNLIRTLEHRHEAYNEAVAYVRRRERAGSALVLCPDAPLAVGARERDPARLWAVYRQGRAVAERNGPALRAFAGGAG